MIVHHCDWAGQPDIHIVCEDRWTTPSWSDQTPGGPYLDETGRLYAFDESQVTCGRCLDAIRARRGVLP